MDDKPPTEEHDTSSKYSEWCISIATITFVIGIWIVAFATIFAIGDFNKTGQFGDGFGGITALFSGLAFAGIVITLYLQRGDLQLQREMLEAQYEELKATREELAGQKEQMEQQNQFIEKQNFESTFFNMLADLSRAVDSFSESKFEMVTDKNAVPTNMTGREMLEKAAADFVSLSNQLKNKTPSYIYRYRIYLKNENDLGVYFRTLYNLIKYIDRSSTLEKKFYTNIVRARLSTSELVLLAVNCTTDLGEDEFLPLVNRYSILKHLPDGFGEAFPTVTERYAEEAFQ